MKMIKNKTFATLIALILMLTMAFTLVAIPTVSAQAFSIYISAPTIAVPNYPFNVRLEVIPAGSTSRIQHAWTGVTLAVRYPGSTAWTNLGPYNVPSNGRLDQPFTATEDGTYGFMWIVPPQRELPTNPDTTDGTWRSAISETVIRMVYYATYAYINAVPNPVGVGQEVLLHVGITQQLALDGQHWRDLTVTVTRPDNTTETLGPYTTDSTGGTGGTYTPATVGNYTLQTHFPGQQNTATEKSASHAAGTTMKASDSWVLALVVQEDPIPYYPGVPLPTEYWTRPIDSQNREWYTIAGSSWETDYNEGPESAHILWVKPFAIGGVAGGEYAGEHMFDCGDAYAGKWSTRYIIAGILLTITDPVVSPTETIATDLRTGEELWRQNFTFSFGQIYYHTSMNRHCAYAYMWRSASGSATGGAGTVWMAYDPWTGSWVYNITNIPSGTRTFGSIGEILLYSVSTSGSYMTLWNSSWAYMEGKTSMNMAYNVLRTSINATTRGYQWNITIPTGLPGSVRSADFVDTQRVVGSYTGANYSQVVTWAFSLKPGEEGKLLYNRTATNPTVWADAASFSLGPLSVEDGVFTLWCKELRQYWGYSLETGELLWGPTEPEHYLNIYDHGHRIAYGKLYSAGVSGEVRCYNVTTGELLWIYHANDPYQEILWNNDWWMGILFITDGKVYLGHEEHSPIDPLPRGAPFVCLNATTGEVIWRADGLFRQTHWGGVAIIGDSIIVTQDTYDQRMYAIGKGPSATTVTAPDIGVPVGSSVLIRGTVTDVSPGTNDIKITLRFPNGVPAVSDESMSDWMKYVYKQFARPADATGVNVTISVLDPNNNSYEVGRTTGDASGFFSCEFIPEVSGKYTVFVSFEGSRSYYGSFAETAVFVEEALQPTPTPTPMPESIADMYFVPAVAGIIIAIAIATIINVLLLRRKRP